MKVSVLGYDGTTMTSICIFEDADWQALRPITDIRPFFTITIGGATAIERIQDAFPNTPLFLNCRPGLSDTVRELKPELKVNPEKIWGLTIFINGRVLMTQSLAAVIQRATTHPATTLITHNHTLVALITSSPELSKIPLNTQLTSAEMIDQLSSSPSTQYDCDIIKAPWDVGRLLGAAIGDTTTRTQMGTIQGSLSPTTVLYNDAAIHVGPETIIEDFVVLDARSGPIIIADNVIIESHSRIVGPTFIGDHSQILGGKIRGCSIGPWCKISGEVSNTIFAGYSNKSHDGFWGNSYVGHWVNIGAGSITSNLKNTYGTVQLHYNGIATDSGQQFLGSIVGDHCKLGIGTHLNTGTIIGTGSSIVGTTIHPKWIPNFSWGTADKYHHTDITKFLSTTQRVYSRRRLSLSASETTVLQTLHTSGFVQ